MENLTQRIADFYQFRNGQERTEDKVLYSEELIREIHNCEGLSQRKCSALPDNYDSH